MDVSWLRDRYRAYRSFRYVYLVDGLLLFGFIALLPFLIEIELFGVGLGVWISLKILIITLIWAYSAQAWNIMSGFTGQFSFGHAAFLGIGAYATMTLLLEFKLNPWLGLLVGAVLAGLYGMFIGALSFRYNVEGHYFALVTLAFAELLRNSVVNIGELGAAIGFYKPAVTYWANDYGLFAFQFRSDLNFYYLLLGFLVMISAIALGIKRSSMGYYFFAIKENEDAAASLGIPVNRYKIYGVTISAFFTAWAGGFWAMYFEAINPNIVLSLFRNIEILLPAIVGGPGTVIGPILGAFVVIPLSEYVRVNFDEIIGLHRAIFGFALVIIVLYSPKGIVNWHVRLRHLLNRRLREMGGEEREEQPTDD